MKIISKPSIEFYKASMLLLTVFIAVLTLREVNIINNRISKAILNTTTITQSENRNALIRSTNSHLDTEIAEIVEIASTPPDISRKTYNEVKEVESKVVNPYPFGFAPWHVFERRVEINRPLPVFGQHTSTWIDDALNNGLQVDNSPKFGSIYIFLGPYLDYPHVAFVEKVNADDSIWISNMNCRGCYKKMDVNSGPGAGWGVVTYKLLYSDEYEGTLYKFID
jgi:surface antigen